VAPICLDHALSGRAATRDGNRSEYAAPHGAYRCADGESCTPAVRSDEEWRAFCRLAGLDGWAERPDTATLGSRKRHEADVDALVRPRFSARAAEAELQSAGLAGVAVATTRDLYSDPQLAHREYWRATDHPFMGRFRRPGPPFRHSDTPGYPRWPAHTIGEDNERFYRSNLGLSKEEYRGHVERGVID
jgi:benzylsuccinate CoA-transferase BbsF subunit